VETLGLGAGDGLVKLVAVGGGVEGFEAAVLAFEDLGGGGGPPAWGWGGVMGMGSSVVLEDFDVGGEGAKIVERSSGFDYLEATGGGN
jgi:hypothetical protein